MAVVAREPRKPLLKNPGLEPCGKDNASDHSSAL